MTCNYTHQLPRYINESFRSQIPCRQCGSLLSRISKSKKDEYLCGICAKQGDPWVGVSFKKFKEFIFHRLNSIASNTKEFKHYCKLNAKDFSDIMNGERSPSLEEFVIMCRSIGLDPSVILKNIENKRLDV